VCVGGKAVLEKLQQKTHFRITAFTISVVVPDPHSVFPSNRTGFGMRIHLHKELEPKLTKIREVFREKLKFLGILLREIALFLTKTS
jgi:hypothetical protein